MWLNEVLVARKAILEQFFVFYGKEIDWVFMEIKFNESFLEN